MSATFWFGFGFASAMFLTLITTTMPSQAKENFAKWYRTLFVR